MPVQVSYPGVYVEEIPSGVRTITGVATSITAFVGTARRGPTDQAMKINSFGDFERVYGGLWLDSPMSYAVRDFYLNGGTEAIIVRLFHSVAMDAAQSVAAATVGNDANAAKQAAAAKASTYQNEPEHTAADKVSKAADTAAGKPNSTAQTVQAAAKAAADATPPESAPMLADLTKPDDGLGGLKLRAASEGRWGTFLRVTIDKNNVTDEVAAALGAGLTHSDLFNLTVRDAAPGGITEKYLNLTVKESARRIDRVLAAQSNLVRWDGTLDPNNPPAVTAASDAVSAAEATLATAQKKVTDKLNSGQTPSQQDLTDVSNAQAAVDTAKQTFSAMVTQGGRLAIGDFLPPNGETNKRGLFMLEQADLFNLLCLPPYNANGDADPNLISAAIAYCEKRRAVLLVDPPSAWNDKTKALNGFVDPAGNFADKHSRNAAIYFPRLLEANPLRDNQIETYVPCGAVAGLIARTDATRGVWKAPAGTEATLLGVAGFSVMLTDQENGDLNPVGINCLRAFPVIGRVSWGARTLRGADQLADEYKYLPVRRLALYIEESLYRGLKWVVFEPNDEPLWAQIRLNVGAFMNRLFRQGAFQGTTPREAYFVKCDKETTTQGDINLGIVNIVVGFAPLKPAEFVIIKLQQMAGQIET
jgi:phage tail sheath protein FI